MLHKFIGVLVGASALICLSALPASAQSVTGTVNVTGTVAGKCQVVPGGGATFTGTIALGELAEADGTLLTSLEGSTSASPAGSAQFQVLCNTAAPTVQLTATSLVNAATAPTGYADTVRYTAEVDLDLADDPNQQFTYDTATSTGTATTPTPLGDALSNVANNVTVSLYDLNTAAATDVLVAGNYAGAITVVIAPN